MALRHQFSMYLHFKKKDYLAHEEPRIINGSEKRIVFLADYIQRALSSLNLNEHMVFYGKGVVYLGQRYMAGSVVILGLNDDGLEFGLISEVVKVEGTIYLICECLFNSGFDHHFHAYEVMKSDIHMIRNVETLYDYHPLGLYSVNNMLLVPLKYVIARSSTT